MPKPKKRRFVSSRTGRPAGPDLTHTQERAEFWRVSIRVMQQWKQTGRPVDDVAAMVKWYSGLTAGSQGKLTADFRRRLLELRVELEHKGDGAGTNDPDYEDFQRDYKAGASEDRDTLGAIRRQRAYYLFKLTQAQKRNDYAGAAEATKHFTYFSKVLHDAELADRKLGRDSGELYAGEEVERVFRAVGFWLMNGADTTITALAKGLQDAQAAAAGPLDREAVRKVVEPIILLDRVMAPLVRSVKLRAGVAIPKRFVESMKGGAAAMLENGAAEFEVLYGETPVAGDRLKTAAG